LERFCFLGYVCILNSALLICAKYIAAAIFMADTATKSDEYFNYGLSYVGGRLDVFSALFLAVGIAVIAYCAYKNWKSNSPKE